jgi:hypothetical protein
LRFGTVITEARAADARTTAATPKAVVEVDAIIRLCANNIFMLRSVARQHAGEVLEVSLAECGGSRVESYFHNLILKIGPYAK